MIEQSRLKELIHYNPKSGALVWRKRRGSAKAGSSWGCVDDRGYILGMVDGAFYRGHQLAFIYMTGALPEGDIDHKNGEKSDNRWSNLRPCTRRGNMANCGPRADNTSGFRGVTASPTPGRWIAQIRNKEGGTKYLGTFENKECAAVAYDKAAVMMHGEMAKTNFPQGPERQA